MSKTNIAKVISEAALKKLFAVDAECREQAFSWSVMAQYGPMIGPFQYQRCMKKAGYEKATIFSMFRDSKHLLPDLNMNAAADNLTPEEKQKLYTDRFNKCSDDIAKSGHPNIFGMHNALMEVCLGGVDITYIREHSEF